MVTEFSHLQVADLTKEEHDAALECGTQLDTLRFRPQDDYEVCDDNEGLEIASRTFIEKFAPWSKFGGKGSKLKAFRFLKSATLPVPGPMLLIPTTISGKPTITGLAVDSGKYVQLNKDVLIEPGVTCLVFKAN